MQIAIVGATGPLGGEVIRAALDRQHRVRALARQPQALAEVAARITVVRGDVRRPESLHELVDGADVVVSALGRGTLKQARVPSRILEEGTRNLVEAMQQRGVRRLLAVSSVGVADDPTEEFVYRHIIKRLLRDLYEDMRRMEDVVQRSQLDWVLVRPPLLLDKPAAGRFVTWPGGNVPYGYRLPRPDLANFLIGEAEQPRFAGSVVGISDPTRRTPAPAPMVPA